MHPPSPDHCAESVLYRGDRWITSSQHAARAPQRRALSYSLQNAGRWRRVYRNLTRKDAVFFVQHEVSRCFALPGYCVQQLLRLLA
jgi:hypothetical protein